jgi:hypothetical protein
MAQRPTRDRRGRAPVQASLSAQETYRLGDPIEVTFSLTNTSNTPQQVLRWGTPLEDEVNDFLIVTRDGEDVPYDGRHVKRGEPTDAEYVLLAPGEQIDVHVDVSRSYGIQQPGHYRATIDATIFDVFPVTGNAKRAPRLRDQHQRQELPQETVEFTVVPGDLPKRTDGQQVRAKEAEAKDAEAAKQKLAKAKDPNFNGGTTAQQDDTRIAHSNAQFWAALSAQQLNSSDGNSNALYEKWFGAFDQGRYDEATDNFSDINKVLETETVTYDHTGSGCASSWFAYTYGGSRTVWLCNSYLNAPQIGTDCKFGTLIHEWSHAVSGTADHAYGQTATQNLATNDPAKAIDNADNHEYFAEELAQADFGKALTFITDRSQFGKDEVDALLVASSPAVVEKSFYVHADGFWPGKLGITATSLGSSPNVKPTLSMNPTINGMSIEVATLQAEDTALPVAPQRFTWVLRAKFTGSAGFPSTANAETLVTLTATLAGLTASAQIRLVKEASPYELDGPVSWLSTDVRVFKISAGQSRFGAAIGSTPAAASTFIKQVVANLNSGSSGGQSFDGISTDQQTSSLELAQKVNGTNVYNFAVAKVRYVGTLAVSNVRVFFRLFPVSTTSAAFAVNTSYRRSTQGTQAIATLGVSPGGDLISIPCFAEPRVDSATTALTTQTDPSNVVASMPASSGGKESVAYFGAWLDTNQTQPQFPTKPSPNDGPWSSGRKTVQELITNAHQCLVAEIAYDGDPISEGATPGGSDKLAQRNLSIVKSANPGQQASRRIANVFELWPATLKPAQAAPDELLIEWGNVPAGTAATIYIPEVDAGQIVALAGSATRRSALTQLDDQTISVPTGGISYVPMPVGATFGLTGLLTLDLPDGVKKGAVYTVVVRQLADAYGRWVQPAPEGVIRRAGKAKTSDGPAIEASAASVSTSAERQPALLRWRQIVGSYQITIPVQTHQVMLADEVRLLSVLRWILGRMSADERWYPVFSRYVGIIADRVGGLGGNPDEVRGSPEGVPDGRREEEEEEEVRDGRGARPCLPADRGPICRFEGKVTGIVYDCYGEFEGFLLDDCGREMSFRGREREMEEVVSRAWRERVTVSVVVREASPRRPVRIILRHLPVAPG